MTIRTIIPHVNLFFPFRWERDFRLFPKKNPQHEKGGREIERLTDQHLRGTKAREFYLRIRELFQDDPHQCPARQIQAIFDKASGAITREMARNLYFLLIHDSMVEKGIQSDYLLWLETELGLRKDCGRDDELPYGFGSFGRQATNPIPVQGIVSEARYLNRLVDSEGNPFSWKKIGKTKAPNVLHFIDVFKGIAKKGGQEVILHIYPLNQRTSQKAPEGFQLI